MTKDLIKISKAYHGMLDRCYNSSNHAYKDYGARGIEVCDEWLLDPGEFFKWVNKQYTSTVGLQLDRIDVNGNYSENNCRWVTPLIKYEK